MEYKKYLTRIITTLMCLFFIVALTGCSKSEKSQDNEFTYWLGAGENTDYYLTYEENPVVKYITNNKTFKNSEGEEEGVSFNFIVPPKGKEVDNLNTLLSTGSYPDIIDLSFGSGSPLPELYENGTILDLTEYVENEMPNYKKYLDEHPDIEKMLSFDINGEKKYLKITSAFDSLGIDSQFCGFSYRRDWIVKYGTQPNTLYDPMSGEDKKANPKAGGQFSGYYSLDKEGNAIKETTLTENVNGDSWVDDVVFPSGNTDPIYISDWEWMFEIFQKAISEQEIEDGYVLSLYYPGYIANGDLVSAFGGGGPTWYNNGEEVVFGAATDDFKTYLECMNTWWNNDWIDKRFAERSSDVFFRIDETTVRQGKVGFWMGLASTLDSRLYNVDYPHTEGIVVYGAPQPINDIYGTDDQKLKIPYTFFQGELAGGGIIITDKAKDKDIKLLCHTIDYMFSEEGATLKTVGLSAEQMVVAKDETYIRYGLEDGAYKAENIDGQEYYIRNALLEANDGDIQNAMTGFRVVGLNYKSKIKNQLTPTNENSRLQWIKYMGTGFLGGLINAQLQSDNAKNLEKIKSRLEMEYMYINVPKFIIGEKNLTSDWETFVGDLEKRDYQKVCDFYNIMPAFNQNK